MFFSDAVLEWINKDREEVYDPRVRKFVDEAYDVRIRTLVCLTKILPTELCRLIKAYALYKRHLYSLYEGVFETFLYEEAPYIDRIVRPATKQDKQRYTVIKPWAAENV